MLPDIGRFRTAVGRWCRACRSARAGRPAPDIVGFHAQKGRGTAVLGIILIALAVPQTSAAAATPAQRVPTPSAPAVRISSIQPTCAAPGTRVTITGIGFGAGQVRINVGTAAATLVTATGTTATFIVPATVTPGTTTVTARNPGIGSATGSISFQVSGPELCDGIDNSCDGRVDEGFDVGAPCSVGTGACARSAQKICAPDHRGTICPATPGTPRPEQCNGIDDDCDGQVDNGFDLGTSCTVGVGACARTGKKICSADGGGTMCDATPGTPTAETCNGLDDDCNGTVDDGFDVGTSCSVGVGACVRTGEKICSADGRGTTCDATPGTPTTETCNGLDDDCDGTVDNGFAVGAPCISGIGACARSGTTVCAADGTNTVCDAIPGSPVAEVCNGIDDNCDGSIDEGVTQTYYRDADGDGYGDANQTVQACAAPPGDVAVAGDCDDTNAAIHPGATEIAGNGVDEDCDGSDLVTNRAPVMTSQPVTQATATFGYAYQATASDPEGEAITWALLVAPSGMTIDAQTGRVSWVPSASQLGNHAVTVEALDPEGAAGTQAYQVSVVHLNLSPIITSVPVREVHSGQPYLYHVEAFEPEGEPVTYDFAADPPAGMAVDPQTGLVTWTAGSAGEYAVAVRAHDPGTGADVQNYLLTVFDDPLELISPAGAFQVLVGDTLTLPLQANYAQAGFSVDPLPSNASIDGATFTFTPVADQQGAHTMAFQAHYGGMHAGNSVVISVLRPNSAPEITPLGTKTVDEGQTLVLSVQATDADGDTLNYSAPGLNLPNAYFNEITHQLIFTPSFEQAGSYQVTFAVSDGAVSTLATAGIEVADVTPPAQILDLVVDPLSSPTFETMKTVSGSVIGEVRPPPEPEAPMFINGLSPTSVRQGRSAVVEISGWNTQFAQGVSTADFGDGIVVEAFDVLSPTSARAAISADPQALAGVRQVRVLGGGTEAYSIIGFTVETGAATISGTVLDPFTQQPLANARVGINGTNLSVLTDEQGHFVLDGVAPGSTTLVVTSPNYEVRKIDLAIGVNQSFTFSEPLPLNALARPASPGGMLPRAATVASVLDRGVANKGGGLTLEQAKMVVADTLVAVGGDEVGVLDDGGNQLNSKIQGTGALSLTPVGVERQAKALMQGDVYTLKEFIWALEGAFRFRTPPNVPMILTGFQEAVNQAWANPADPRWSMALVLFNEGTTLSSTPPRLSPDTRINRFQAFLLLSSFMLYSVDSLERSAERILDANGIDWKSLIPTQTAQAPTPSPHAVAGSAWAARLVDLVRDFRLAAPAFAQQVIDTQQPPPRTIGDLMARKTFTNVWRAVQGELIAESTTGAAMVFGMTFATHMIVGAMLGSAGGVAGALGGVMIAAAASAQGFMWIAFQKVVLAWFIGLVAAAIEPGAPSVDEVHISDAGNLVITVNRSQAEVDAASGSGPVGFNPEHIGYAYELYRFADCFEQDLNKGIWQAVPAQPVLSDPRNQQTPPLGKLQFVIPRFKLQQGTNYFRVVTFQYIGHGQQKLVRGASDFDSDGDGKLSLDEFIKKGLGDEAKFRGFDVNGDGLLDDSEFKDDPIQDNPAALAHGRDTDDQALPFAQGTPLSAAQYAINMAQEQVRIENEMSQEAAAQSRFVEKLEAEQRVALDEFFSIQETDSAEQSEFDSRFRSEYDAVEFKRTLCKMAAGSSHYGGPNAFLDESSELSAKFAEEFGRPPSAEERLQLYEITKSIEADIKAGWDMDGASLNEKLLTTLRTEVETATLQPGETKTFEAKYQAAEGGSDVVRLRVEVTAETQVDAIAKINSELSIEEANYQAALREQNLVRTTLKGQTQNLYSPEYLTAKTELTESYFARRPAENAAFMEHLALNRARERFVSEQMAKTRSGRGAAPDLEAPPYAGAGTALNVMGAVTSQLGNVSTFLANVTTLSSEFGACVKFEHSGLPLPTEEFPPSLVAHPDQNEVSAVLRTRKDDLNAKGGFIERGYPMGEAAVSRTEAGFPAAFLTTDIAGRVSADNRNSNVPYSGRLFRFTPMQPTGADADGTAPLTLTREFLGTVNYYSLQLQTGRPAFPVAMVAGPPFWDLREDFRQVETQDLFVANLDVVDGRKQILRVPVSLIDTHPSVYYEASGNRQHLVGQPYIDSDEFQFSGPSDMEVGPSVSSTEPLPGADGVIMLSDEDTIFAIFSNASGGPPQIRHVAKIAGRRWSGLAFDPAGKFYFADYAHGELWVMTWDRLRGLIESDNPVRDDATLRSRAFLVAQGLSRPGDIEIEQGSSGHPARALFISTFWGVDKRPLPIVGRLTQPVRDMRIKRLQKEDAVHILADGLSFFVEPTYDDLQARRALLRIETTDPETGGSKWVERQVVLAEHGVTVLDGWKP